MLDRKVKELMRFWADAKKMHLDSFTFSTKSGRQFEVKKQANVFNIYSKRNKLVANNISNIEDLANCMTLIENTK